MLDAMKSIKENIDMVVGFDLVNEEDYNMPLSDFLEQILITREEMGSDRLQFYFHAGESNSRSN